jgi:hypothetical protein
MATVSQPLKLYADGAHDDTDALQAWYDGIEVLLPDGTTGARAAGSELAFPCVGTYLVSRALLVSR